eukprot:TRINITY_DN2388_c0_g1_i3.p1 TRINITY_DN2388_c0_g1~~TRINITY_DN2388_c0_g1_i3.p1  ORF type:complete len:633 (-),score=99.32 TRINITY_DN2388_c0_g1_i3:77-1906(-)
MQGPSFLCSVVWSLGGCLAFGTSNFVLNLLVEMSPDRGLTLSVSLIMSYSSLVALPLWLCMRRRGDFFKGAAGAGETENKGMGIATAAIAGMCLALAYAAVMFAFSQNPRGAGPLSSVISSDVVVYSIFCRIVYKERITSLQWAFALLLICGLVTMGLEKTTYQDVSRNVQSRDVRQGKGQEIIALLAAVFGMLSFTAVNITVRMGMKQGITIAGRLVIMFMTMSGMGLLLLMGSAASGLLHFGSTPIDARTMAQLTLPLCISMLQALGTLCVTKAFEHPSTNIFVVIMGLQSTVVLVLAWLFQGLYPGHFQLWGMGIIIVSVIAFSFSRPQEHGPEEANSTEEDIENRRHAVDVALSDYGVVGDSRLASTYASSVERSGSPDPDAILFFETCVVHDLQGKRLLDIGCGSGRQIREVYIPKQPECVVGLDLSPLFVKMAEEETRAQAASSGVTASFVEGDMHQLLSAGPKFEGSFDLLVSCFALHYCDNLPKLFKQCWQLLKPGGRLVFLVNMVRIPAGEELPERVRRNPTVAVDLGPHLTVNNKIYTDQQYLAALKSAGFVLLDSPCGFDGNHKIGNTECNSHLFEAGQLSINLEAVIIQVLRPPAAA